MGVGFAVICVTIYVYRETVSKSLTKRLGACFTAPVGVVRYTFANGRGKVLWTTFQIINSITWTLPNVTFPAPFGQFLDFIGFVQLDFLDTMSASCIDARQVYSNIVLITSLIPIVLTVILILVYFVRVRLVQRHKATTAEAKERPSCASRGSTRAASRCSRTSSCPQPR